MSAQEARAVARALEVLERFAAAGTEEVAGHAYRLASPSPFASSARVFDALEALGEAFHAVRLAALVSLDMLDTTERLHLSDLSLEELEAVECDGCGRRNMAEEACPLSFDSPPELCLDCCYCLEHRAEEIREIAATLEPARAASVIAALEVLEAADSSALEAVESSTLEAVESSTLEAVESSTLEAVEVDPLEAAAATLEREPLERWTSYALGAHLLRKWARESGEAASDYLDAGDLEAGAAYAAAWSLALEAAADLECQIDATLEHEEQDPLEAAAVISRALEVLE
jgi:hypothetical protein